METNAMPNKGQIPWLPKDHVVETLATVSRDQVKPLVVGEFPLASQNPSSTHS